MIIRFLSIYLLLVLSQQGVAVDCSEENITLSTQEDVDGFQEAYGSCDNVTGDLTISGSMTNLDGLLSLRRIGGDLIIEGNTILDNLDGLKKIKRVQGDLRVSDNRSQEKTVQRGVDIDGESAADKSGISISFSRDGSVVAIGAEKNDGSGSDAGHTRIYRWQDSSWKQVGSDINGANAGDRSGAKVSISGDGSVVAIGAIYNDRKDSIATDTGHVRAYKWENSSWTQLGAAIEGKQQDDYSGSSVSLSRDGNVLAIGSPFANGAKNLNDSGTVRVYEWSDSNWIQKGDDIDGEATGDLSGYYYGMSLSSNGNTLAIGAPYNDGNGVDSGHVRVYRWVDDEWIQVGSDIDGKNSGDWNGWSVSLDDDGSLVAMAGVYNDGNGVNSGHVRVYRWNGRAWLQRGQDIYGVAGSLSGYNLSLSGDGSILAVGAIYDDLGGNDAGRVDVYHWSGETWKSFGDPILGESAGDQSGTLALSSGGSVLAIGAYYNDGTGINSGHIRVFDLGRLNCTGLSFLLGWPDGEVTGVAGETKIVGNGTGCNSISEILASSSYFQEKQMLPATLCKASDPSTSIKLQSKETGLTNTETVKNISVVCPLSRKSFTASTSKINSRFSVTLRAEKDIDDTTGMSCTLREYIGETFYDLETASINFNGTASGSISWSNWRPTNRLTNYTIICELTPQTSITSIETRVIY